MDEQILEQEHEPEQETKQEPEMKKEDKELSVLDKQPDEEPEKPAKANPLAPYYKFLIGAGLGIAVACLIMWLGFWRVFFVCLMAGFGAFLLGTDNKKDMLRKVINRIFPQRH